MISVYIIRYQCSCIDYMLMMSWVLLASDSGVMLLLLVLTRSTYIILCTYMCVYVYIYMCSPRYAYVYIVNYMDILYCICMVIPSQIGHYYVWWKVCHASWIVTNSHSHTRYICLYLLYNINGVNIIYYKIYITRCLNVYQQ